MPTTHADTYNSALRAAHEQHSEVLRNLDHAILTALEYTRHPDDLPAAAEVLRDARRGLLHHWEDAEDALWHQVLLHALSDDVRPLFLRGTPHGCEE